MSHEIKTKHRRRFNRWSRAYDRSILHPIIFDRSHNMFLKEMTPFLNDGIEVLDVGCGTGNFAFKLSGHNRRTKIHGVDISEDMIGKARSKLRDEGIDFKTGDVEELPYESDTFDIITCSNSFHHYPNQRKAVSEMHRVLRNDGKLMIVDGYCEGLLGKIIFGITELVEGHVYHVTERELREMLLSIGFHEVIQKRFNPIAPLLFTLGRARK